MKTTAFVFAIFSAITGGLAAYCWYIASRVNFVPFMEKNGKLIEVPETNARAWTKALKETVQKSGSLNKTAAIWTGISIAFAGLSNFFGAWAN